MIARRGHRGTLCQPPWWPSPVRQAPSRSASALVVESRETEQTQLVLGVRAPDRHSADRFALAVLNHVLGGGLSSRLFQEIREARGLAYSIGSDRSAYDDAGTLGGLGWHRTEHVHEVLDLLHAELDRLGAKGITPRELEVAKGHLRADMLLSLEDSGSRMSRIGSGLLLFGTVLTTEDLLGRIEAVTAEQVRAVASQVLTGRERWRSSGRSRSRTSPEAGLVGPPWLVGFAPAALDRTGYRDAMKRVGVFGAAGRMGATVCAAVLSASDLELVVAVDPVAAGRPLDEVAALRGSGLEIAASPDSVSEAGADVVVDFTVAAAAREHLRWCADRAFTSSVARPASTRPISRPCSHLSR